MNVLVVKSERAYFMNLLIYLLFFMFIYLASWLSLLTWCWRGPSLAFPASPLPWTGLPSLVVCIFVKTGRCTSGPNQSALKH